MKHKPRPVVMKPLTPKQRVLRRWSEAYARKHKFGGWTIYSRYGGHLISGYWSTPGAAWASAAMNLK